MRVQRSILLAALFVAAVIPSCASAPKKPYKELKGEFMIVDEDKDLDLIRIEDVGAEGRPGGGCPT
jgi:hypothetical protein